MTEGSIPNNPAQDLEAARQRGRWLSDEEQAELDRQNQRIQLSQEQDRSLRRRLTLLTAVCVLLPPLWPVAFGLSFYLLFPQTAARIGLVAGVVLLLGGAGCCRCTGPGHTRTAATAVLSQQQRLQRISQHTDP